MSRVAVTLAGVALLALPAISFAATPSVCPFSWNKDLKQGASGADVKALQQFLNADVATQVAASGTGSAGSESTLFGAKTKAAVIKFQENYFNEILAPNGLSNGNGNVGPSTRATLNALCGATQAAVPANAQVASAAATVSTDTLTVSLPEQPAFKLAVNNALYVPFTNVTLTAGSKDVDVRSTTISRTGLSKDAAFFDVDLMDDAGTVLSTAYLHSDHRATFTDSFTVPAGTSMTVSLVGDMAADLSDFQGQQAFLQLESIDASSPVVGTLPVKGTGQWMNSTLTIGSASAALSQYDPGVDRTVYIGDTTVKFSGIRVTTGAQEDMRMDSITWEQTGTAGPADVANVVTVVNGASYPAEADGRWYTSSFPGGIEIKKGNTADIYVQGDVLPTGVNRTVKFDIHWPTDVYLFGQTYGYGIYLLPGGNTSTSGNSVFLTDTGDTDGVSLTPFFSGATFTVNGATINYVGR